ncbi:tRNA lysidine(34) synthetase TilS [Humisphaera borealis]|uniref:tRNA(Ile)-lysidine synthase n=1 Tax=Humisphaera borealis TaxID=2807512 RepID=A0A7M2X2D2_9BACT|nr:tRNA lysidine(34) synthetase TilS [Humisphaera borealis]QOV91855.1 tRNA lysidine(34) synthetase TilS [Humisphaera borealis]
MSSTDAEFLTPTAAIAAVEPGRWGVAVSGGADSVAMLRLSAERRDLSLHVIHLNHQTRGRDSDDDAAFVAALAGRLGLASTITTRERLEESLPPIDRETLPGNPSARYRTLRLELYRRTVEAQNLQGVLLAHHADDQAESVLLRLLRGGGYPALAAMAPRAVVAGVVLRRPLLAVRRQALRHHLDSVGQSWREDASNATGDYARNRVRAALAGNCDLAPRLLRIANVCRDLDEWVGGQLPPPTETLATRKLADLPEIIARAVAAQWLKARGVPADEVAPAQVSSLLAMCHDAATPSRLNLPGDLRVVRRRGMMTVEA